MRRAILTFGALLLPLACNAAADATPAPRSGAPVATGPRVVVRNTTRPGACEIVARAAVALDSRLIVERQTPDGGWAAVPNLDLGTMRLVETCGQEIGACVALDVGRTFRPVPWSGMSCASQCNLSCDKNVPMAGKYRFVVQICNSKERVEGAPFVLAASRATRP